MNAASAQSGYTRPVTRADIEQFADLVFGAYVRESQAPSLAVIVVRRDAVIFQKGYGYGNDARKPVRPDSSIFHIASVSKLFVATAMMQLADAGRVRLDDEAAKYLPTLRLPAGVTVRHLLTHTSGMDAPFMRDVVARPRDMLSLEQYFDRYPPKFGRAPGGEIRYSNHGMALAARIVERVSGESFDAYAERHILRPLGMRSSTFLQPPPPDLEERVATAGAGRVPNLLLVYPAGAMISTVADIGRFMRMHLNGGRLGDARVLSDTGVTEMHRKQWSAQPAVPGVALGFFETDIGGERALFHTGARTHFSALVLLPERDIGIYIVHAMRQGGRFQSLRLNVVRALVQRYFPRGTAAEAPATSTAAGRSHRLQGVYRPVLLSTTTIERAAQLASDTRVSANTDGSLRVDIPAGATFRVVEQSPGVYRVRDGDQEGLTIAFSDTLGLRSTRMSLSGLMQDPVSFDRLAWYQRGRLHALILAIAYAVLATFFIGKLAMDAVARLRRRAHVASRDSPAEVLAWRVAVAASVLLFLAPIAGALLMVFGQGDGAAAEGVRRALAAALSLVLLGALLAIATIPFGVLAWHRGYWSPSRRVYYTTAPIAAVLLWPLLIYYHLLVFWI